MSPPVRLAVLGDPLAFTLSPVLHRAGAAALGLACESRALRTPVGELPARLRTLADEGCVGCNLTHPLKEEAAGLVASRSALASRARSVNTIAFRPGGWAGETTDGPGFLDLLAELGLAAASQRVVMLGAGGATRSLAVALIDAGVRELAVSARSPGRAAEAWADVRQARFVAWRGLEERRALSAATLVVNGTPLAGDEHPVPLALLPPAVQLVDLTYGEHVTPWVLAARAAGFAACEGLGLLVHQARRSLEFWFAREVPVAPLAAAVGWPR